VKGLWANSGASNLHLGDSVYDDLSSVKANWKFINSLLLTKFFEGGIVVKCFRDILRLLWRSCKSVKQHFKQSASAYVIWELS